jgi:hypothetical protein
VTNTSRIASLAGVKGSGRVLCRCAAHTPKRFVYIITTSICICPPCSVFGHNLVPNGLEEYLVVLSLYNFKVYKHPGE